MTKQRTEEEFLELEKENQILKEKISSYDKKKKKVRNRKLFILQKLGGTILLGPKLKKSLIKILNGDLSKDAIAEVIIAGFYRVTRIGLFALIIALIPICLTLIQAILLNIQNGKIEHQNQLINQQTTRIIQQTYMADSEMKRPQRSEMNDLIHRMNGYFAMSDTLSLIAISDISSTTFRFNPYRYLDEDTNELTSKPYSPEKSAILLELLTERIDPKSWRRVKDLVNFDRIHIRNFLLPTNVDFSYISVNASSFRGSTFPKYNFSHCRMNGCSFEETWIRESTFRSTFAPNCNFENAHFERVDIHKNTLQNSNFRNVEFWETTFDSTDLVRCDFRDAEFIDSYFNEVKVKGAIAYEDQKLSFKDAGLNEEQIESMKWVAREE